MNTVFVVKNSAYQFMAATPDELKMNWVSDILKTDTVEKNNIADELSIIHSSVPNNKITYKIRIGDFNANISGDFMLLRNKNNLLLPLDEKLEDYLVNKLEITKVKLPIITTA